MTLTRFLTGYIYNPLALWLTRRRLARGKPGFSGRNATVGAFVSLLMFPTVITMFVSGLWHGAGYGFVIWGLIHGFYLTLNHGWRVVAGWLWPNRASYDRIMKPMGLVLTFVSVTVAMVFFRAPTITSAIDLVKGIIGLNGIAVPKALYAHLGPLTNSFHGIVGVITDPWTNQKFTKMAIWILFLMFIALACPNTLQILARYQPALGVRPETFKPMIGRIRVEWAPSFPWAIAISAIGAIAILYLGGPSEFLYWQF